MNNKEKLDILIYCVVFIIIRNFWLLVNGYKNLPTAEQDRQFIEYILSQKELEGLINDGKK